MHLRLAGKPVFILEQSINYDLMTSCVFLAGKESFEPAKQWDIVQIQSQFIGDHVDLLPFIIKYILKDLDPG